MYILGIESSYDETSAAVIETDGAKHRICSNIVASQIDVHRLYGGVVPEIAGRAHIEAVSNVTYRALEEAGITIGDISLVGVTASPGLIGALLVGVNFGKSLAFSYDIPLVAVDHVKGHTAAAYLEYEGLKAPFLSVVVSGGHTSIYEVRDPVTYVEIGATRDDAAGEAFDKIARVIGIPYPGGAGFDRLAKCGDKKAIAFPSPAISGDTLDFSFSGLKTAALNYINLKRQKGEEIDREDLAASYTDTIVRAVTKKVDAAITATGTEALVLAGGVAANSHLRAALETLCKKRKVEFCPPSLSLCSDNAAMIAMQAYFEYQSGSRADTSLNASAV
ncbi:MAG: tRNA (adenosine(37)-N6)-threonylcarbamoyltransferase complex transferase subunit TsaD [Clostridia bacterium]|nr:tRNA (adenosine(37)-N6)-threonylcarbamoyltransferase complex transferase subunit TsaD [Clostridia bacterium]